MPYIQDAAKDALLGIVDNATHISLTTSEITSYASLAAAELLEATSLTWGSPADGSPNGRSVTLAAKTGVAASGTGTATHWCLHNNTDTVFAAGALASNLSVTSGNNYDLSALTINVADATAT